MNGSGDVGPSFGSPLNLQLSVLISSNPHNMAWGGADGRTLFLAAQTGIYELRHNVAGILPKPATMARN